MDEERKRILRMFKEGSITVEECEELLGSLSKKRTVKVAREVRAAEGKRPVWPYVLLVCLGVVAVLMLVGVSLISLIRGGAPSFTLSFPFLLFLSLAPLQLLGLAFWVWMLIDCITRMPCDYRLLFTSQHEHEKWIWIAAIILTNWVGALIYFFVIRRPAAMTAESGDAAAEPGPGHSKPAAKPTPATPYVPSPRARSLLPWLIVWLVLVGLSVAFPTILYMTMGAGHGELKMVDGPPGMSTASAFASNSHMSMAMGPIVFLPVALTVLILGVFWVWMLIDCLVRDHRDFGVIFADDTSIDKIVWLLLILFMSLIGAIAYHIAVRRRRRPEAPPEAAPL